MCHNRSRSADRPLSDNSHTKGDYWIWEAAIGYQIEVFSNRDMSHRLQIQAIVFGMSSCLLQVDGQFCGGGCCGVSL